MPLPEQGNWEQNLQERSLAVSGLCTGKLLILSTTFWDKPEPFWVAENNGRWRVAAGQGRQLSPCSLCSEHCPASAVGWDNVAREGGR